MRSIGQPACVSLFYYSAQNVSCFVYKTRSVRIQYVQKCIQYFFKSRVGKWGHDLARVNLYFLKVKYPYMLCTLTEWQYITALFQEWRNPFCSVRYWKSPQIDQVLFSCDATVSLTVTAKTFYNILSMARDDLDGQYESRTHCSVSGHNVSTPVCCCRNRLDGHGDATKQNAWGVMGTSVVTRVYVFEILMVLSGIYIVFGNFVQLL